MSFHRIEKLLPLLAAVSAIALMTGCGGGGGIETTAEPTERPINIAARENPREIATAAQNDPAPGSVTQSTNAESGVTADRVNVTWERSGSGNRYRVTNMPTNNGRMWEIDTNEGTTRVVTRDRLPATGDTDNDDQNNRGPEFGVGLMKELDDGTLLLQVIRFPDSFDLEEFEDENVDYLSAGLWAYVPDDDNEDPVLGAFADGSGGFDQQNLQGLEGTARYMADNGAFGLFLATGIEDETDLPSVGSFFADVELTAVFGNQNELGTISGHIFRFEGEDGEDPTPANGIRIVLLPANIGSQDNGFFNANTELRLTPMGESIGEGKWGGQFYRDGTQRSDHPGAVAGTFGAHTANPTDPGRTFSIIGAYMAPLIPPAQ